MSLTVSPYIRDNESGKIEYLYDAVKEPFNDLFGLESWRDRVWGSKTVKGLECIILPTLQRSDIFSEGTELEQLRKELNTIIANLDEIARTTKVPIVGLQFRLENALEAVRIALDYENGGVNIG